MRPRHRDGGDAAWLRPRRQRLRAATHQLIGALYRELTIENLKKMMNVFFFDASSMTDELFQTRLDNILARRDHLENFVKSSALNPKQFPDFSHRLHEITAQTLLLAMNAAEIPADMPSGPTFSASP
jgi:hypothetical protein